MRRVAHLSDVHILDPHAGTRRARYRLATRIVGLGRSVDPGARGRRLATALAHAKAAGADHVVISGDLTEVGEVSEFEHFAQVLHDAKFAPENITLVPGNHDAYTQPDGWTKAMRGPLAPFAASSAGPQTTVVDRGPIAFVPIDSTRFQTIAWSGGVFTRKTADRLSLALSDPGLRDKALVLVLHHPPYYPKTSSPFLRWVDGLRGCGEVLELLARHPRLQLLHGHLHRFVDRILAGSTGQAVRLDPVPKESSASVRTRVFGAPATCDGPENAPRIRLYDLDDGALRGVARAA